MVYTILKDYTCDENERIEITSKNSSIEFQCSELNLDSHSLICSSDDTVKIRSANYASFTITGSNEVATIQGNVEFYNNSSNYSTKLSIINSGMGCAVKGSNIVLNGKIYLESAANYALHVTADDRVEENLYLSALQYAYNSFHCTSFQSASPEAKLLK